MKTCTKEGWRRNFAFCRVGVVAHRFAAARIVEDGGRIHPPYRTGIQFRAVAKRSGIVCGVISTLLLAMLTGCAVVPGGVADPPPTTAPAPNNAVAPATSQPGEPWAGISKVLERPGALKDGVYVITVPRDDLDVTIEHMGIPTAAGIESVFYFYKCPCGKMNVVGQFVACDYEANDVVDALRPNALLKVPAIAPFLLYENPRLLLVRFQGEGDPVAMAGLIREALRWTGRERMAPTEPIKPDQNKPEPK